jgi:CO/xanthine dehydrogenase Mo-binding subunit
MVTLSINGEQRQLDVDPDMPLLWALRDVGKDNIAQVDGKDFVTGKAEYGYDVELEGQKYAVIDWDHSDNQTFSTKAHEKAFAKTLENPKHMVRNRGDWQTAKAQASDEINAEYYTAGLSHSMMEPPAAAARIINGHQNGVDPRR